MTQSLASNFPDNLPSPARQSFYSTGYARSLALTLCACLLVQLTAIAFSKPGPIDATGLALVALTIACSLGALFIAHTGLQAKGVPILQLSGTGLVHLDNAEIPWNRILDVQLDNRSFIETDLLVFFKTEAGTLAYRRIDLMLISRKEHQALLAKAKQLLASHQ